MIINIRNIRFSEKFRKEMNNLYSKANYKNPEVRQLMEILAIEPLNRDAFDEVFNGLYEKYKKAYLKTHPLTTNISISKDMLSEIEAIFGMLGTLIKILENSTINGDAIISSFKKLIPYTNIRKYDEIEKILRYSHEPLKKHSSWFRRFVMGLGIVTTIGAGIAINKMSEESKHINATETVANTAHNMTIDSERMAELLEAKKHEEERIKKFKEECQKVRLNRKEVIGEAYKIVSRMKMPANCIKPDDVMALMFAESRFDPNASSHAGAKGLMQVLDGSTNIAKNIVQGMELLKEKAEYCKAKHPSWTTLSDEEKRDIIFAAYNCGQTKLNYTYNWNIIKSNDETVSHNWNIRGYLKYV